MDLTFIKKKWCELLLAMVLLVGLSWRLFLYFWDVSLWHDEILLATSIVERGFLDLLAPLEHGQVAPHLFLFAVEAVTLVFGDNEWSLRLVPWLSGCLGLIWMWAYARKYLDPLVAVFACSIMAFANPLVMYTVHFKQYSGDLLASVIALHMFTMIPKSKRIGFVSVLLILILPWFSFTSIFVIAGLAGGYGLYYLFHRDWRQVARIGLLGVCGGLSFIMYYLLLVKDMSSTESLVDFWIHFYFWEPLFSWRSYTLLNVGLSYMTTAFIGMLPLFVVGGLIGLWKNPKVTLPCVMVFGVTVIAVVLEKYPFCERLILFLFPFVAIILGQWLTLFTRARKVVPMIALFAVIAVFLNHLPKNWKYLVNSPVYQEVRDGFVYVEENQVSGDFVYLVPPIDQMSRYYGDYTYLKHAFVLDDRSDEKLLHAITDKAPLWVMSETRRADQSEFLSQVIDQVEVLSEQSGHEGYELFYIEFKRTMLLYLKPLGEE